MKAVYQKAAFFVVLLFEIKNNFLLNIKPFPIIFVKRFVLRKKEMKHCLDDKKLKHNPYKVPEGYFDSLPSRTFTNLGIEMSGGVRKPTLQRSLLTVVTSIAASLVIALSATWYIVALYKTASATESYFLALENSLQEYSLNTLTLFLETDIADNDVSSSDLWVSEVDENLLLEVGTE